MVLAQTLQLRVVIVQSILVSLVRCSLSLLLTLNRQLRCKNPYLTLLRCISSNRSSAAVFLAPLLDGGAGLALWLVGPALDLLLSRSLEFSRASRSLVLSFFAECSRLDSMAAPSAARVDEVCDFFFFFFLKRCQLRTRSGTTPLTCHRRP